MQKTLFFKSLIIIGLMLLIAVPLMMIESTISERIQFRGEAVRSIAQDSVNAQTFIGPVLVIPYTETYDEEEETVDPSTNKKTKITRQYALAKRLYVYPNDLKIKGKMDTDFRHRGIHQVLVYSGQHSISGDFTLPTQNALIHSQPNSHISMGSPFVAVGLSDTRGLKNFPNLVWGGRAFEFRQGSKLLAFQNGLHAPVPEMDLKTPENIKFNLDLAIDGMERMEFIPIAKSNQVNLSSAWPHPQFGGRFLPSTKDRSISDKGFNVNWNISSLSSNAQAELTQLEINSRGVLQDAQSARAGAGVASIDSFSLAFIEPINIYSQADRAVKYGMLFIALTFAAFFLFEIMKQLRIHPVQYVLVGLALAIFFLLLVSLSEHMSFLHAYLLASLACIVLIAFYLSNALRSWVRGLGFGVALTLLYGVLFGLLQSENNALVMGAMLLFAVLAAIMVVTRKVDWYQLGKTPTTIVE